MAKAAPKKKANSARRKVQVSTARSRKDVSRSGSKDAAEKKVVDNKTTNDKKIDNKQENVKVSDNKTVSVKKTIKVVEKVEQKSKQKVSRGDQIAAIEQGVDQIEIVPVVTEKAPAKPGTAKKEETTVTVTKVTVPEAKCEVTVKQDTPATEKKSPKIILHSDRHMGTTRPKAAPAAKMTAPTKRGVVLDASAFLEEMKTDEQRVAEVLQEIKPDLYAEMPRRTVASRDASKRATPKHKVEVGRSTTQRPVKRKPTAKERKEAEIQRVISMAQQNSTKMPREPKKAAARVRFGFRRVVLAMACAAAAVFAIVYFVNQSTPNISLKVAAMQSGIDAKYPTYIPRDYSLSDITSENGKITLNFRNAVSGDGFTIIEERSSWDSNALVSNYVKDAYGDDYTQVVEQGLTIFVNGSNACWVNGGVVYKLKTTSGTLTKKQIKAIAVSL